MIFIFYFLNKVNLKYNFFFYEKGFDLMYFFVIKIKQINADFKKL